MILNRINFGTLNKVTKLIAIACTLLLLPIFINNDFFIFSKPLELICEYILFSVLILVLLFLLSIKLEFIEIYHKNKKINIEDIPYIFKHRITEPEECQNERNDSEANGSLKNLKIMYRTIPKFVGIVLILSSVFIIGGALLFAIFSNAGKEIDLLWFLVIGMLSLLMAIIGFSIVRR